MTASAFVQFNQKLHSSKLYNGFQIGVSAIATFTGGMRQGMSQVTPSCFVAGTMILTAMGLIAIENIKAGDKVISTDPETMETAEKIVLETYIREVDKLVYLTINGEEIITTFDHPFYVRDRGFVNACELWLGAQLLDANNNILIVENTRLGLAKKPVKVYNFQVEDYHTYSVGENSVFVHNAGDKYAKPTEPYNRKKHYGNTPTKKDRQLIGGSPDHDPPLVKRYYEGDPSIGEKPGYQMTASERKVSAQDRSRMKPSTKAEQNSQGGRMSQYSKEMKAKYGLDKKD